jgi:hypothetical protein
MGEGFWSLFKTVDIYNKTQTEIEWEHKKTMTYDARNPGHILAQAQTCGGA